MVTGILVGVDGSDQAQNALLWAADFVANQRERGLECRAVAVAAWNHLPLDGASFLGGDAPAIEAKDRLADALASLDEPELFEPKVQRGSAVEVVLAEADRIDADLIIVGTRGRGGLAQVLFGRVSRAVASQANRPVAVVASGARWSPGPTVVGFDDSPGARSALRWAIDNREGEIKAVSAWYLPATAVYEPGAIDVGRVEDEVRTRLVSGIAEVASDAHDRIVPVVQREDPRLALLDRSHGASMIVLGARARHGIKGLLLGSTVDYVAAHSTGTTVIVPPPGELKERSR